MIHESFINSGSCSSGSDGTSNRGVLVEVVVLITVLLQSSDSDRDSGSDGSSRSVVVVVVVVMTVVVVGVVVLTVTSQSPNPLPSPLLLSLVTSCNGMFGKEEEKEKGGVFHRDIPRFCPWRDIQSTPRNLGPFRDRPCKVQDHEFQGLRSFRESEPVGPDQPVGTTWNPDRKHEVVYL